MKIYHAVFIIRYNFINSEYNINSLLENLMNVTENRIEVLKTEYWGLISFAYAIAKKKKGHYISIFFKSDLSDLDRIREHAKSDDECVRCMFIAVKKVPEKDSVMLQEYKKSLEEGGK